MDKPAFGTILIIIAVLAVLEQIGRFDGSVFTYVCIATAVWTGILYIFGGALRENDNRTSRTNHRR